MLARRVANQGRARGGVRAGLPVVVVAGRFGLLREQIYGPVGEGFGFGVRVDDLDVGKRKRLPVLVNKGRAAGRGGLGIGAGLGGAWVPRRPRREPRGSSRRGGGLLVGAGF